MADDADLRMRRRGLLWAAIRLLGAAVWPISPQLSSVVFLALPAIQPSRGVHVRHRA